MIILLCLLAYPVIGWCLAKFCMSRLIAKGDFDSQGNYIRYMNWRDPKRSEPVFLYGFFAFERHYADYLFVTKEGTGLFVLLWPVLTIAGWFYGTIVAIGKFHEFLFNKEVQKRLDARKEAEENEGKIEIYEDQP